MASTTCITKVVILNHHLQKMGTLSVCLRFSCSGNYLSGVASGFSGAPAYYTFVTANDSPPRDPNGWDVRLCHNGSCGQTIRVRDQAVTQDLRHLDFQPKISEKCEFLAETF